MATQKPAREKITFENSKGEQLAALLEVPSTEPRAYAIFAHCFTCSKDIAAASRISRALADKGIAVLRFDFTGLGNSDGDFANTNFSSNVSDLLAAAQYLQTEFGGPELLIGHSLGGAAVLAAASELPQCKGVVTIGAPSDPGHVSHLFACDLDTIEQEGAAEVELAGRKFTIQKQFLDDIAEQKLLGKVSKLGKALLVMHSPVDATVSVEHAKEIYLAAKHPKSFISLDGADHLLSRRSDSEYVAEIVAAWAGRYIADKQQAVRPAVADGEVLVVERGTGFTQDIYTDRHHLFADEPLSIGGQDLGLSPYELLSAALGACTSMTIRMYAKRKNIPLQAVSVRLRHDKIHASDCENCDTQVGKVDRIEREISFQGELDVEQQRRLLEIADKCPVHRTLHSEINVTTKQVEV